MSTGVVKWFDHTKGYGFIKPDEGNKDVFVHINAVHKSGLQGLTEGDRVGFEIESEGAKQSAVNLTLVK